MQFDPENPVVRLCAEGMAAEALGRLEEAQCLFRQAWDLAGNDLEALIAAHYIARNQPDHTECLRWNLEALRRAGQLPAEQAQALYPSLYLNIGKAYEDLNDGTAARKHYELAAGYSRHLPDDAYGRMIAYGIRGALERTGG